MILNTHLAVLSVLLTVILKQNKLSKKLITNAVSLLELCVIEKRNVDGVEEAIYPVKDSDKELDTDEELLEIEAGRVIEEMCVDSDDESYAVGEVVVDKESNAMAEKVVTVEKKIKCCCI